MLYIVGLKNSFIHFSTMVCAFCSMISPVMHRSLFSMHKQNRKRHDREPYAWDFGGNIGMLVVFWSQIII